MPAAPGRIASGQNGAIWRAVLARLPPWQKLVLELRVFDERSIKENAELADCSENTAAHCDPFSDARGCAPARK